VSMTVTITATTVGVISADIYVLNQVGGFAGRHTETTTVVTAAGADLATSVTDSADPVSLGDTFTYTQTVTNNGPTAASNVTAATTLSGGAGTIRSATPSQGSCAITAPTVNCSLGALGTGASATVTITVEPTATGTLTATSSTSATESDPDAANNSAAQATTIDNGHGCTIFGSPGVTTLSGSNGSDVICGFGYATTINGGNGNDVIYAGSGDSTIDGGNGDDIIYAGDGNDILNGGNGNDTLYGGAGNDRSYGEDVIAGVFAWLFDSGNDTIVGGPGDDVLDGQAGNDNLTDTQGTDTMKGSNGNDTINVRDVPSPAGGDTADGGGGTDTCTIDAGDTAISC
jgi:uncharacterized repeat protein (TIGR01451 family)